MNDTEDVLRDLLSNPMALLYLAVIVLVLFIGLLVFDPFRGEKRRHHGHGSSSRLSQRTLRQRLLAPFVQMRANWMALASFARRRARRRARAERVAEEMRRYSK
jgi:hypothetical protein